MSLPASPAASAAPASKRRLDRPIVPDALDPRSQPHRRLNRLTGDWVLVSPHRTERPWQGRTENLPQDRPPSYDPGCYLCPGNERAGGRRNPPYTDTYVFDNDFPALREEDPAQHPSDAGAGEVSDSLLVAEPESGICRVVCFSPRHDLTLAEMDMPAIRGVVDVWTAEYKALGMRPDIGYVQIFENKGEMMGCSNPHPHGQIWAQRTVPTEPAIEGANQARHHARYGRTLLGDYLRRELEEDVRIVCRNDTFVALVPFWAVWPFETLVLPRRAVPDLTALDDAERDGLADVLKRLTTTYDRLFGVSFPYSAGLHQAPTDGEPHPEWHLHMHFYPPLLRSATVRKFMVGYEMLGMPQRDLTPEAAAARLRSSVP